MFWQAKASALMPLMGMAPANACQNMPLFTSAPLYTLY